MNNEIILWHGGRDLEYSYKESKSSKKGRWEHGPGIYLTTHYERAFSYAKGGGKTYLVKFEEGNNISNILMPLTEVTEFINKHIIISKRKKLIDDIYNNSTRMKTNDKINADCFLNLIINYQAISNTKTNLLNKFLVDNNVDYLKVDNFGGRNETVIVIFNKKKILKVNSVSSKEVNINDFELSINLLNDKKTTLKY